MQVKTFFLPVLGSEAVEADLNKFLSAHRVLEVDRQWVSASPTGWAVLVVWRPGEAKEAALPLSRTSSKRPDPRESLSEAERERFECYRTVRLQIAQREEVKAFVVFSNRELADMARLDDLSEKGIASIDGVGAERARKYADEFIRAFHEWQNRVAVGVAPAAEVEADQAGESDEACGTSDGEGCPF